MDFPLPLILSHYLKLKKAMENEKNHIIPYRTLLYVLAVLITLTLISVAVTQISLGTLTVAIALLIAAVKSSFVLRIFMHLKFENRMLSAMVIMVILIICAVILITLLDYIYR
jgi:cytochrome c oxidase subunit 4